MMESLPCRKDVPILKKWDITDLFSSDIKFYKKLKEITEVALQFRNLYSNTLDNPKRIEEALEQYSYILIQLNHMANYVELRLSVDVTDENSQTLSSQFSTSYGKIISHLSFLKSNISKLPNEKLDSLIVNSRYSHYLKKLKSQKPYQLSHGVEEALAYFSPVFEGPFELYNNTKFLDITFPSFQYKDLEYPMDYSLFNNSYEKHPDTYFRRKSFSVFSTSLKEYQHTVAATYNMHVQQEKIEADLRGYDSVIDYLLQEQEVTREMFNRQIDITMNDLAPIMQKYAKLIKRIYGLEIMRFEDLKVSIDPEFEPGISIEDSKRYIYGALNILGEDYLTMVKTAYHERWIDFAKNKGKETGAYCAGPYAKHPYIFISWNGKMEETFILAHELGHAGHFVFSQENQFFLESQSSLYFSEAPSTMNEILLSNYLFKQNNTARFKRWVVGSVISRTYYHNMVTHILESAFQREVYTKVDSGYSLTAPILNKIMKKVYRQFFGDSVVLSEGSELTWMRQPHYYMGLYSYTYSAGLTIGTVMAQRIENEGQSAVDEWLNTLKLGGSAPPVKLAQAAGVDITTSQPLKDTIKYIGHLVNELDSLTNDIEKG